MKNKLLPILVICVAAAGAWAFWHYGGSSADTILSTILIVVLLFENHSLRKQVQTLKNTASSVRKL